MRNRSSFSALRWLSLFFILSAVVLLVFQLIAFSRLWANFPTGLSIAGVPVSRLDRQQASKRLLEIYSRPIELHYNEAVIQVTPNVFGFDLDLDSMLAVADLERTRLPFWSAFWNYLWARSNPTVDIPLRIKNYSEDRLRIYLQELASRYDEQATPAMPVVGTINFQPGRPGTTLDIDRAILPIETALRSPSSRIADLPLQHTAPTRPPFQNLEVLLRQTITISQFDGIIGMYVLNLQNGDEIRFISTQGQNLPIPPDVAFTASSTIKIPIMVSVFRHLPDSAAASPAPGQHPLDAETMKNLADMIGKSVNPASDWLMQNVLDQVRGPLLVSQDMRTLGLEDTFLAGYFAQGAPLLQRFKTAANQRTDVNTDPDPYSQTTPTEIGMLLQDLYQCAQYGGGSLIAAFPGEITQAKCETMITYLASDKIAQLVQAGVPDGTRVAHKHGWVSDLFGVIHNMSDAAIVYTPGGDFVIAVFLYHPTQLVFEPSNKLVADLARAVYNYYNLPQP